MNTKNLIEQLNMFKKKAPDLIIRKIKFGPLKYVYIVLFQTLTNEDKINDFILKYLSNRSINDFDFLSFKTDINEFIPAINKIEVNDKEKMFFYLFNGFTILLFNNEALAFETKGALDRSITEPSSEPTVKGPKDAFNENINTNIGLVRRRIKSTNLSQETLYIGKITNSRVNIIYLDNIAENDLVLRVKNEFSKIDTDGILDSYYLKEFIKTQNKTLFPIIKSTEKPDEVCKALMEGKICVLVENSPNVLIIPTFFIDLFKNSEDYYQLPFFATFTRIIRILAFFIAIILPAYYLAVTTFDQQLLPTNLLLNFTSQRSGVPFPALFEALFLMLIFEILYEGDSRTPSSRGTSLSILGALVLGDAAVNAGLVSPIMVIVIAITAICSLLFIYLNLQAVIRFWRYLLMILTSFFGIIGLAIGIALMIANISSIKSFGKPYLLPFSPFNKNGTKDALIRTNFSKNNFRKSYLTKKNRRKGRL